MSQHLRASLKSSSVKLTFKLLRACSKLDILILSLSTCNKIWPASLISTKISIYIRDFTVWKQNNLSKVCNRQTFTKKKNIFILTKISEQKKENILFITDNPLTLSSIWNQNISWQREHGQLYESIHPLNIEWTVSLSSVIVMSSTCRSKDFYQLIR